MRHIRSKSEDTLSRGPVVITLLNLVALIICVVLGVLWLHSYSVMDSIKFKCYRSPSIYSSTTLKRMISVGSIEGELFVFFQWDVPEAETPSEAPSRNWSCTRYTRKPQPNDLFSRTNLLMPLDKWGHLGFHYLDLGSPGEQWIVGIPLWLPFAMMMISPISWISARLQRQLRKRQSRCVRCGYDLRATVDRCPECGLTITR